MSNTIDDKVVEMRFENGQFEQNIHKSIDSLDELKEALELKKAGEDIDRLQKKFANVNFDVMAQSLQSLASHFTAWGRFIDRIIDGWLDKAKNFAKELSIGQAQAGFSKYEKITTSTQTIHSALPDVDLSVINDQLAILNKYTDDTSYDFVQMVDSIGKFTSAGIDLEKSVTAMMGIGNWAGSAGASVEETNRAMYNLSQTLATGSVKLIDWKSIENANMATKEFKEQVIETAKAMGVLNKEGKTSKGTLVTYQNFGQTLSEGWFTSDVLMAVLEEYADVESEVGKKGFEAAKATVTFSQAMDAIKDTLSSGWMRSFQIIFGDMEESIELWSSFCDAVIEATAPISEWRNELLQSWRDLGGRDDLLEGISNIWQTFLNIIQGVKDAFATIFPPFTVEKLTSITKRFKELTEALKNIFTYTEVFDHFDYEVIEKTNARLEEFDRILSRGMKGKDIKQMQEWLESMGYDVGPAGADGVFGPKTEAALKKFREDMGLTGDVVWDEEARMAAAEKMGETWISKRTDMIVQYARVYSGVFDQLKRIFQGFLAIAHIAGQALSFVGRVLGHVWKLIQPVVSVLLEVGAIIGDLFVALDKWIEESGLFGQWFDNLVNWLKPVEKWFKKLAVQIKRFFGIDALSLHKLGPIQSFADLWDRMKKSITETKLWKVVGPTFEKIKKSIEDAIPVLKEWYESAKTWLIDKWNGIKSWFGENWEGILTGFIDFFTGIWNFIKPILGKIPDAVKGLGSLFSGLMPYISSFASKIPGWLSSIGGFFSELWTKITGSEKLQKIWGTAKSIFKGIFSGIATFFTQIWNAIKSFLGIGEEIVSDDSDSTDGVGIVGKVTDKVTTLVEFGSAIGDGAKKVKAAFTDVVQTFDVWKFMSSAAMVAWDWFKVNGKYVFTALVALLAFIFLVIVPMSMVRGGIDDVLKVIKAIKGPANQVQKKGPPVMMQIAAMVSAMALMIGVMVGAIYLFSRMTTDELVQGGVALLIVLHLMAGIVLAMMLLTKKIGGGEAGKSFKGLGQGLLEMTIAIGILVGVIYILSKMKWETFFNGIGKLAILCILVVVLIRAMGRASKTAGGKIDIRGFQQLGIAILLLTAALVIIALIPWKLMWKGLVGLAAIFVMLMVFMHVAASAQKKAGTLKLAGLIAVAGAVLILVMALMPLAFMPKTLLIKGLIALGFIFVMLGVFIHVAKGFARGSGMGALWVCVGIAVLIGTIAVSLLAVSAIDTTKILAFMVPFGGIILAMALIINAMKGASLKSGLTMLIPMLGIVALLVVITYALSKLKSVKTTKLVTFMVGLAAFMLAFGLFMKLSRGISWKTGLGIMIAVVSIAGLIYVLTLALNNIKDVDTNKMTSFMKSISILMVAIGGMVALAGIGGIKGGLGATIAVAGIIAVITAFVALWAGLSELAGPKFQKFMNSGAAGIGEAIGSMVGAFQGASIKSMYSSLEDLNDLGTVDTSKLDEVLEVANKVAGFLTGLGGVVTGGNWEETLNSLMGEFGNAFVASFRTMNIRQFAQSMSIYSQCMSEIDFGPDPNEGTGLSVEEKGDRAMKIAEEVNGFLTKIGGVEQGEDIWETANSLIANWGNAIVARWRSVNIAQFGKSMLEYSKALAGIEFNEEPEDPNSMETKTGRLIDVATQVNTFLTQAGGIEAVGDDIKANAINLVTSLSSQSVATMVSANIAVFGKCMKSYADSMKEIDFSGEESGSEGSIEDKTSRLVTCAAQVNSFLSQAGAITVASDNVIASAIDVVTSLSSQSVTTMVSANIAVFGKCMKSYADTIGSIELGELPSDENSIENKTTRLVSCANAVNEFLSKTGIITAPSDTAIDLAVKTVSAFANEAIITLALTDIPKFANAMVAYNDALSGVTISGDAGGENSIEEKTGRLVACASAINTLLNEVAPITPGKDIGTALKDMVSGWVSSGQKTSFNEQMVSLAGAFDEYATSLNGVEISDSKEFSEKTGVMIGVSRAIAGFLTDLSADSTVIEGKKSAFNAFFTGETTTDSLLYRIGELADKFVELSNKLSTFRGYELSAKFDSIKTILNYVIDTMIFLAKDENVLNFDAFGLVTQAMKDLSTTVWGIQDYIGELDSIDDFVSVMNPLAEFASAMAAIGTILSNNPDVDSSKFLEWLDIDTIRTKLTAFSTDFATSMTEASASVADSSAEMMNALTTGMTSTSDATTGADTVATNAANAMGNHTSEFRQAGTNAAKGFGNGMGSTDSRLYVIAKANALAKAAIDAVKRTINSHSPSRVFAQLGAYSGIGFANGMESTSGLVSNSASSMASTALSGVKTAMASLSSIIAEDIDPNPVVKPVVDLSDVTEGAHAIEGMLSQNGSVSFGGMTSRMASVAVAERSSLKDASENASMTSVNNSGVNLTGNNFYIRDEQDIHNLASEIAAIKYQEQRSYGG